MWRMLARSSDFRRIQPCFRRRGQLCETPRVRSTALLFLVALSGCAIRAARPDTAIPPARLVASPLSEVAPKPSPGCKHGPGLASGWLTLHSGGHERHFLLRLPPDVDAHKPLPLVFNFHGWLENARQQEIFTFMTAEAAKRGMAVVYPQGWGWSWNAGTCCGRAHVEQIDDIGFVKDLVKELESQLCIDENRVYSTGMSNGAIFSYKLACELSDTFAAIAPVDGAEDVPACTPTRPVPVLAFNGKWDHLVWFGGGGFGGFPAVEECSARWAKRNGCTTAHKVVYEQGEATCIAAQGCAPGADVTFCSVEHGGHTWPGGAYFPILGHTTSDLDATPSMLDFFLAHPKR